MRAHGRSEAVLRLLLTALVGFTFGCSDEATNADAASDNSQTDHATMDVGDGSRDALAPADATNDLVVAEVALDDIADGAVSPDLPPAGS